MRYVLLPVIFLGLFCAQVSLVATEGELPELSAEELAALGLESDEEVTPPAGGEVPALDVAELPPAIESEVPPATEVPIEAEAVTTQGVALPEMPAAGGVPEVVPMMEAPVTEEIATPVAETPLPEIAPMMEEPVVAEEPVMAEVPEAAPVPAPEMMEPTPAPVTERPMAEEEKPPVPEGIEEVAPEEGLDTVDLEGGNWLFKRVWWKYAEQKYEKIKQQVANIMDARVAFFTERNRADRDIFDPFYIRVGFDRGEMEEVIAELLRELSEERDEADLSDDERNLLSDAQDKKDKLASLQTDVTSISHIDQGINEALDRVMQEINRVRQYEKEAWEKFKTTARILDDQEARKLYYEMDRLSRSLASIEEYLKGPFSRYFYDQLLAAAKDKVQVVQTQVQELKDQKIVDLKKEAERLENSDALQDAMTDLEQSDFAEASTDRQDETGWLQKITAPLASAWNTISGWFASAYNTLYNSLFGPGEVEEEIAIEFVPEPPTEALEDIEPSDTSA